MLSNSEIWFFMYLENNANIDMDGILYTLVEVTDVSKGNTASFFRAED
jgi:hypothetical protein